MASRSRKIATLLDADGDVVASALDNVETVADVDEVVQSSANSISTSALVIDSTSATNVRAVTFRVTAFLDNEYQFTTINAVVNSLNNDCDYCEFGTIQSSELSTYQARIYNGDLQLLADPISSGIEYNIARISIEN